MTAVPLSSLSLFPASRAQTVESRTRTFVSWGRGMTLEEYLERDARLDNHEVSKNNRFITWVLARRDSPDTLDFMCSCETFWREGLVRGRSTDPDLKNKVDEVEDVDCCAIASVFTPAANRGKGYARHMMKLLHWVVAPRHSLPKEFPTEWGAPPQRPNFIEDAAFSVLYSDVGPNLYRVSGPSSDKGDGWDVTNPVSTIWNVSQAQELLSSVKKDTSKWKWFDENSINDAWNVDASLMKEEISKFSTSATVVFSYLPTKGVAEFQHHRLQQFWAKMVPKPEYWGICLDTDSHALDLSTFASWAIDFRPPMANNLTITRLRTELQNFAQLLAQIIDFAKQHSVAEVEVWNLPTGLEDTAHAFGGKTILREEHLPSFKWYGHERHEDVSWLYNEKFCWC